MNGAPVAATESGRRWMLERAKELAGRAVELRRRMQAAGARGAERERLQGEKERCEIEMDELVQAFKVCVQLEWSCAELSQDSQQTIISREWRYRR